LSKADPDDAGSPNPTGAYWNFQPTNGEWCLLKDDPADSSNTVLGTLYGEAGVEKTAVYDSTMPISIRGYCRVLSKFDQGKLGFVFGCSDQTSGSEDLGVFMIDLDNDELELLEYSGGSASDMIAAISQTVTHDTWYYLGFEMYNDEFKFYFTSTAPSSSSWTGKLAEICTSSNHVFDLTYVGLSSGNIGFMSIGTLARFDDLYVEHNNEHHVPADQVNAAASALFRTIMPFSD
jgi:hypothetical protein